MKSEEMNTQSKTAYGAASISREGLEKMVRNMEKEKSEAWEQSQKDIVGFLFELPDILNSPKSRTESREQEKVFGDLDDYLRQQEQEYEKRDRILCLANDYGIASEEYGFRNGFAMAMKICMHGMGGTY